MQSTIVGAAVVTSLKDWRELYISTATQGMAWMLARPMICPGFINTKFDPLTLVDRASGDGLAGPDFTYGWIQGRALEALAEHELALREYDSPLADKIRMAAVSLHAVLLELLQKDSHAYFCYGPDLVPVVASSASPPPQLQPSRIYTYSDIFVAKGLLAAAVRFGLPGRELAVTHLLEVVEAVETRRFQINERQRLETDTLLAQPDDFGPRMILLGAADLMVRLGVGERAGFADRLIEHVLSCHLDAASGLLRNEPSGAVSNVGHAIEFAGFAISLMPVLSDDAGLNNTLCRLLDTSFAAGFNGAGLVLEVDVGTARHMTDLTPWWSLPETIRAAALAYARNGYPELRAIWQSAHDAFYSKFWRQDPPVAYQMLLNGGPVDIVPATPDLDPGYHTGLALLAAAAVINSSD